MSVSCLQFRQNIKLQWYLLHIKTQKRQTYLYLYKPDYKPNSLLIKRIHFSQFRQLLSHVMRRVHRIAIHWVLWHRTDNPQDAVFTALLYLLSFQMITISATHPP